MRFPFEHTKEVAIELSNACNLAHVHTACPLNRQQNDERIFLSTTIVNSVLDSLARYEFDGVLEFHRYNEPLIDPRLFLFVKQARTMMPDIGIRIFTNGTFLSRDLAREILAIGVTRLTITLYGTSSQKQATRQKYQDLPGIDFASGIFDDRITLYERPRIGNGVTRPCTAPLRQVIVTCQGKVGLCCIDWADSLTFGDLGFELLEEILASNKVQGTYARLQRGDRRFSPCIKCTVKR